MATFSIIPRSFWLLVLVLLVVPVSAQTLPPCDQRPNWHGLPRIDPRYYCYEEVIRENNAGEMPFTALAFAPDGRLFAARPMQGQVFVLRDTDGDFQPDSPQLITDGLTLPNALAYDRGTLYIAAGNALYRLPDGGALETLVDDLPFGTGFWTGGLAVGGGRIYVGIGAPCDFCAWGDPERGSILSFAPDGSDRKIIAQGFRHPAAITYWNGDLYVGDSASNSQSRLNGQDELNQVVLSAPAAHYGFPYCSGYDSTPLLLSSTFDCANAMPPLMTLTTGSMPVAFVPYAGSAFPNLQGKMLAALGGSSGRADIQGYTLMAFDVNHIQPPDADVGGEVLMPYDAAVTQGLRPVYAPYWGLQYTDANLLNSRGAGVWPHRIYGMAISPEGWIYFSVGGGKIASLRPK